MNIQKINSAKLNYNVNFQTQVRNNQIIDNFNIKMSKLPAQDTVSFQGRASQVAKEVKAAIARKEARALRDLRLIQEAKIIPEKAAATKKELKGEERTWGVPKDTAKKIRERILKPQDQVHNFMNRIFGDLKVSELSPKNLILDIADRAKSVLSIVEKSSTRKWNSTKEILENMTDLNGSKIIMNYKTGKAETETVLDRLIPLIKTKQITLKEIELQRPISIEELGKKEQEEYDYVSKAFLDKLEDAQEEVLNGLETNIDKIQLIDRPLPKYTKGNYCALHLLLQLNEKGSRPFELQVMGPRVAKGKEFDDKRFKFFDNKQLEDEFAELIEPWTRLKSKTNAPAKERFLQYCRDAMLQLREDEIREYYTQRLINRPTGFFRTEEKYKLTPEYNLDAQYKVMERCEHLLKKNQAKQEAEARAKEKEMKAKLKEKEKKVMLPKRSFSEIMQKLIPNRENDKIKVK